jgi:hypothetical protein
MKYLLSKFHGESKSTVHILQELWKKYDMKTATDNTTFAWDNVTQKNKNDT